MAKRREMLRAVDKLDSLVKARDTQLEQNEQVQNEAEEEDLEGGSCRRLHTLCSTRLQILIK